MENTCGKVPEQKESELKQLETEIKRLQEQSNNLVDYSITTLNMVRDGQDSPVECEPCEEKMDYKNRFEIHNAIILSIKKNLQTINKKLEDINNLVE